MKVLMIGWEFPPFFSGGLGVVTKNLAVSLGKRDLEVCFALPYYVQKKVPHTAIPNGVDFARFDDETIEITQSVSMQYFHTSIPHAYVSPEDYEEHYQQVFSKHMHHTQVHKNSHEEVQNVVYGKNLWLEIDRFAHQMEMFARKRHFDVIHAHDWITFEAGIRLKNVLKVPLLLHVHATEVDRTGGNVNMSVYDREKYAFEFCDRIITVSQYTKNILREHYGIDGDKIQVVHNAHNIEQPPHHALPHWLKKKPKDDFVVLFIGRLTLQKGPDYFLEVAKRVLQKNKHIKFVIAGTGDMYHRLLEHIATFRLHDSVFPLGFMNGAEKDMVYRNADVCLIPSVSEPFGLIALEAVEHGVPVIISTNSGAQEVLFHSLKSEFWNIDLMAEYVLALAQYPVLRRILAEESYKETRHLTWDAQAEKIHAIYQSLLPS